MIGWNHGIATNQLQQWSVSVGSSVLPSVIVKCGSHSLVLLEAAGGSVGCMNAGGVSCV